MHTALRLRPQMSFGEWAATGVRLCEFASASAWWLGDWLIYGERTYGKRYEAALRSAPLSYQTLRNYAWVARRYPVSCRRAKLSFQHHAEVASLPEADRDLWLMRAERLRWSRNELRRHVQMSRRGYWQRKAAVTVRIKLDIDRQQQWRQAAAALDRPLVEWLFDVADAAARSVLTKRAAPAATRGESLAWPLERRSEGYANGASDRWPWSIPSTRRTA